MAKFSFPYTPSPKNVTELFEKIQKIGVPKSKVNFNYLKSIGFKSSYDEYLVGVLKLLGFVTADGSPSSRWQDYGVKGQARSVMASAIRDAYSELFHLYTDAQKQTDAALVDFFKGQTGASDKDVNHMVQTFKNLRALADFEPAPAESSVSEPPVHLPTKGEAAPQVKVAPNLQFNIEIHIAADTSDDKIETIFKNMKKYLLSNE